MKCKSLASGILLQIVTCINDDWVFHYTKAGEIDDLLNTKTANMTSKFNIFSRKKNKDLN